MCVRQITPRFGQGFPLHSSALCAPRLRISHSPRRWQHSPEQRPTAQSAFVPSSGSRWTLPQCLKKRTCISSLELNAFAVTANGFFSYFLKVWLARAEPRHQFGSSVSPCLVTVPHPCCQCDGDVPGPFGAMSSLRHAWRPTIRPCCQTGIPNPPPLALFAFSLC